VENVLGFFQYFIDGLSVGSLYALIAVGYSLVFGVLQMVNFAHSELYMLGAYLISYFYSLGAPLWVALLLSCTGVSFIALIMERFAYRKLLPKGRLAPFITSVGISLFLQSLVPLVWSPNPEKFPVGLPEGIFELASNSSSPIIVRYRDAIVFICAIALTIGLELFLKFTRQGKGIRAVAIAPVAAKLVGVPFQRAIAIAFILGATMAVMAGFLTGLAVGQIYPTMGVSAGVKSFAAAVLGGIGLIPGALLGGLVIGITESLLSGYNWSGIKDGAAFLILILMLLWKPNGLLGKQKIVKV
jgi:branched-chain amino acid transport system permease protein